VDSLETELIADRVFRSRSQLELAVVEYIGWFNNARLHSALGFAPPAEYDLRFELLQLETLSASTATTAIEGRAAGSWSLRSPVQIPRSLMTENS
jgi:putative transposase